jgi:hypothetical protein
MLGGTRLIDAHGQLATLPVTPESPRPPAGSAGSV